LRERLESAEEMRRAIIAQEVDGFVVGTEEDKTRVVLLDTAKVDTDALLERLPEAVVTVSHAGHILYANQRFSALLRRPLAQLFSSPICDFVSEKSKDPLHQLLQNGTPDSVLDVEVVLADGRRLRSRATSIAAGSGCTSLLFTDPDLSEADDDAEHALQAIHNGEVDGVVVGGEQIMLVADAHRPYRALVDRMQQGAVTISLAGDVLYVNDQFISMVGRPRETLLGRSLRDVLGSDVVDDFLAAVGDETAPSEFTITRNDGSRVKVALMAQRVDNVDAVTLILSDLTERDRHRQIQERARRNDQFLAVLAHELRNPLGSIHNAVEVLGRSTTLSTAERHSVDLIHRQSATLARLVDDLLDVRRLHDGSIVLQRKPTDLRDLVANSVQAVQAKLVEKGQQIAVRLPSEPLYVEADEVRLAQVLGNLLVNACKFTESGGRIEVSAAVDTLDGKASAVRVEIVDNGMGIDKDSLDRIFEPYVQAPADGQSFAEGLGLGLSIAKRLVELHGGVIKARSEGRGRGSVFVFELPPCNAPNRPESQSPERVDGPALKILIADDDMDSAVSLSTLLALLGHETYIARNGAEAIAMAEQLRPHVAILDIGMPELDGYAAARALRDREWGRDMVLYALTGWGQLKDRDRTRDAGFDRHFVKPIAVDELTRDLLTRVPTDALARERRPARTSDREMGCRQ
jgi:PAS domain S-box-containing protein